MCRSRVAMTTRLVVLWLLFISSAAVYDNKDFVTHLLGESSPHDETNDQSKQGLVQKHEFTESAKLASPKTVQTTSKHFPGQDQTTKHTFGLENRRQVSNWVFHVLCVLAPSAGLVGCIAAGNNRINVGPMGLSSNKQFSLFVALVITSALQADGPLNTLQPNAGVSGSVSACVLAYLIQCLVSVLLAAFTFKGSQIDFKGQQGPRQSCLWEPATELCASVPSAVMIAFPGVLFALYDLVSLYTLIVFGPRLNQLSHVPTLVMTALLWQWQFGRVLSPLQWATIISIVSTVIFGAISIRSPQAIVGSWNYIGLAVCQSMLGSTAVVSSEIVLKVVQIPPSFQVLVTSLTGLITATCCQHALRQWGVVSTFAKQGTQVTTVMENEIWWVICFAIWLATFRLVLPHALYTMSFMMKEVAYSASFLAVPLAKAVLVSKLPDVPFGLSAALLSGLALVVYDKNPLLFAYPRFCEFGGGCKHSVSEL